MLVFNVGGRCSFPLSNGQSPLVSFNHDHDHSLTLTMWFYYNHGKSPTTIKLKLNIVASYNRFSFQQWFVTVLEVTHKWCHSAAQIRQRFYNMCLPQVHSWQFNLPSKEQCNSGWPFFQAFGYPWNIACLKEQWWESLSALDWLVCGTSGEQCCHHDPLLLNYIHRLELHLNNGSSSLRWRYWPRFLATGTTTFVLPRERTQELNAHLFQFGTLSHLVGWWQLWCK